MTVHNIPTGLKVLSQVVPSDSDYALWNDPKDHQTTVTKSKQTIKFYTYWLQIL